MTIRKRLFVSNAAIVFISLLMLMMIFAGMFNIAEKTYFKRFDDLQSITVVDRNGQEIVLENTHENEHGESQDSEWIKMHKKEINTIFIMFLTVGAAAIALILILSALFTRLTIKRIMRPVETLIGAANRIRYENLNEPIDYSCDDEFKEVCDAFDEMQLHLKEGIEKNLAYENARITMVTDISHDLRTPLTSVKGYLKGMLDGIANTPEKQNMYLDIAYKKACSMDGLLDKLFYFSKLETNNMPMYKSLIDLKTYLQGYAEGLLPELKGKNSDISFICEGEKCTSMVDMDQMNRVLDNLVENSLKYNKNVSIQICLRSDSNDNIIIFSDNGLQAPDHISSRK